MGESVNATEWPRRPGLGHVCLSLPGVTPSLAKQVGLRVEGGAVRWFGCWKFHFCLDDEDEEPEDEEQDIRDKTLPRWRIWLAAERSRDRRHWRPWRPDKARKQTEEDCEDPERQVRPLHPSGAPLLRCVSPRLAREWLTCSRSHLRNVLSRETGGAALAAGDGGASRRSP